MSLPLPAARPSLSPGTSLSKKALLLIAVALGLAPLFALELLPSTAFASVPAAPAISDLSLTMSAAPNPVLAGDPLVYTLLVANAGPDPVGTPITIADSLPAGVALVAASGDGWSCATSLGTVTCVLPSLGVAGSSSVLITVTAPITGGPYDNLASVDAGPGIDNDLSNNSRTVQTVVTAKADLSVSASGPATVDPQTVVVYTVNAASAGPSNFGSATFVFRNRAGIVINDKSPATPYPATIVVAGLHGVLAAGASIYGFSHTFPEDVDVMLAAPGGAHTILMADPTRGRDVANIDIGFDDGALDTFSCDDVLLRPGIYRPRNCPDFFGDDSFQSPAPAGPYAASLATLQGADSAGAWQLFVRDDAIMDTGSIANGWGLTLTTDLGRLLITDTLPAGMTFVGATGAGWNCAAVGQVVGCIAPNFVTGVASQIQVMATAPFAAGPAVNQVRTDSLAFDPNPGDNLALVTTTVNTIRGVATSPATSNGMAVPGAAITYTLRLTNTGNATDSFTLTGAGNTWPVSVPPAVGPLPLLGVTNVQVVVMVPGDAAPDATDSATITFRSQADPSKTAVATLTTTAAHGVFLPIIKR